MQFRFSDKKLAALYDRQQSAQKYEPAVVAAFLDIMVTIGDARDERDLYAAKSLRFEQLSGKRKGQYSMRLNKQWRLIVRLERELSGKTVVVIEIVDYH